MAESPRDLTGRVCVLTGANRGIGRAAAERLAERGATLELVIRSPDDAERTARELREATGNPEIHAVTCDLASQRSIRRAADEIRNRRPVVDVLVNNAGTIRRRRAVTEDGFEYVFAVNHLAGFLLTHLLLDPVLAAPAGRVVVVSSEAHKGARLEFDDLQLTQGYSGIRAYSRSKLANIFFAYELARRLEGTRVTANALHPGVVATRLLMDYLPLGFITRPIARLFGRSPEEGGAEIEFAAASPELEGVSGKYFVKQRAARSSDYSYDAHDAQRLWDLSAEMTGVSAAIAAA